MIKKLEYLLFVLLAFLVARYLLLYPTSQDTYLHLGIGRFIRDNLRLPTHQDISYKTVDKLFEIYPVNWLSDIIFYTTGGSNVLALTLTVLIPTALASLFLAYCTLKDHKISTTSTILTITVVALLITTFWRANGLIFASLIVTSIVFVSLKQAMRVREKALAIGILMVILANLAGGYVVIPLAYLLTYIFFQISWRLGARLVGSAKHKHAKDSWIYPVFASALVGALINPFGPRIFAYVPTLLDLLSRKWFSTLPGILIATNSSVVRSDPSTALYTLYLIYALFILFGLIILALRKRLVFLEQARTFLPLSFFLVPGFLWVRFIPLSVLGSALLFAFILDQISKGFSFRKSVSYSVSCAVVIICIVVCEYFTLFPIKLSSATYPENAINYAQKNTLQPRVLPSSDIASFLFWAHYPSKGFLDMQDEFFDESEAISLYSYVESIPADFIDNLTKNYRINTVIATKYADYINSTLTTHPDWELFYFDHDGFVYGKTDSLPEEFVRDAGLSRVDLNRNLGFDPKESTASAKQLEKFIKTNPEASLARGQLASIYRVQGNLSEAEVILKTIPADKHDFVFKTEMGRLKAAQGQCEEAEYWLLEAVNERNEKNISRAVLDIAVLYAACLKDEEKAKHYFARYNSFLIPPDERQRVQKLMRDFNISIEE